MELEELKTCWEGISKNLEKQQTLNKKLIEQMTNQNYRNRLHSIAWPEWLGSIFCLITAGLLIIKFHQLDTLLLQIFGILCILVLIVLPVLSFKSIRGLQGVNMNMADYANTLKAFAFQKIRFQRLQKWAIVIAVILSVASIPVVVRLIDEKDITQHAIFWLIAVPACGIFQFFFSKWVLTHYNKVLNQAEELLSEIDS